MFNKYFDKAHAMRKAADSFLTKIVNATAEINNNIGVIREWKPGVYIQNDVRIYSGAPYKCVQAHDSTRNPDWNPEDTPALWMQYHGTTKETARPFVHPTGAHDMYLAGEYIVWTDGTIQRAKIDTVYSPVEYAAAWEIV